MQVEVELVALVLEVPAEMAVVPMVLPHASEVEVLTDLAVEAAAVGLLVHREKVVEVVMEL